MSSESLKKYYDLLRKQIINGNSFGITEILEFESNMTYMYNEEILQRVLNAIRNGDRLPEVEDVHVEGLREFLDVFVTEDNQGRKFYVLVCDSDELWQDPEVIQVIKIN